MVLKNLLLLHDVHALFYYLSTLFIKNNYFKQEHWNFKGNFTIVYYIHFILCTYSPDISLIVRFTFYFPSNTINYFKLQRCRVLSTSYAVLFIYFFYLKHNFEIRSDSKGAWSLRLKLWQNIRRITLKLSLFLIYATLSPSINAKIFKEV